MNKATNLFRNPSVSLRLSSSFSHSAARSPAQSPHDLAACIASLQACARRQNLRKGKQVHSFMLANGFLRSPLSTTSLINMYSKCNQMDDAVSTFNYQSFDHNVFAYNAVIAGFIANGLGRDGFEFYRRMRFAGVMPDKFTFPCVIRGCSGVLELRKIHGLVVKFGLELDVYVGSALVNTYLKLGLMEEAQEVFDELPVRDVVLWNAMVNGFAQIGLLEEALAVFSMMGEEGVVPSRFTVTGVLSIFAVMGGFDNGRAVHGFATKMGYDSGVEVLNALIDMYGKCKCVGDALKIFEMMVEKDIYSWNSIIAVHEHCGDHDGTLRLFDRMLRGGVLPDLVTITTVLPVCARLAALMHGREIHGYMIKNGLEKDVNVDDVQITNAVMDIVASIFSLKSSPLTESKSLSIPQNMGCAVAITLLIAAATLIITRFLYVLHRTGKPSSSKGSAPQPLSTLIVLGSGGHTAEMINLLSVLQKDRFAPRFYIAAATDNMSLQKARLLEENADESSSSQFMQIYRSREVGQSYFTSVLTALIALAHGLWLMIRIRPQVILCNGPGTCVPLCVIAFLFKVWIDPFDVLFSYFFVGSLRFSAVMNFGTFSIREVVGIRWSSVFYVESIARVQRLSLSGLLLYKLRIADQFFVQWPQLQKKYPRAHYVGCLIKKTPRYDAKPQRANNVAITFIPSMLSLKKITARTGMKGKPEALMTLETKEDTSNINPMAPMLKENCVRENIKPYPADAPTVQMTPIVYLSLETPVRFAELG
ncbi:hypothetical protein DVH24_011326 [Malus domestica]|uniref:Uncharacterized protein n=1 Tax=Malus domestica TaxID=3750 RepID=A0A498K0X3_MALDO|nr:hypothetical protein DVH24_011326 [Malus domestica]